MYHHVLEDECVSKTTVAVANIADELDKKQCHDKLQQNEYFNVPC